MCRLKNLPNNFSFSNQHGYMALSCILTFIEEQVTGKFGRKMCHVEVKTYASYGAF